MFENYQLGVREWSKANSFVKDVNYPSNMLYARMLDSAAKLYSLPELGRKAGRIRETIRKQSFDGEFFVDNAVRKDGRLEVTRNRTGTLWEHDKPEASCNHGFASHSAHVLLRDVLGLYKVDQVNRKIELRLSERVELRSFELGM